MLTFKNFSLATVPAFVAAVSALTLGCATKPHPAVVIVSAGEAATMAQSGKTVVVATALESTPATFEGASTVALPYDKPVAAAAVKAPKTSPILVLSSGPGSSSGLRVANSLVEQGFREVHYSPGR